VDNVSSQKEKIRLLFAGNGKQLLKTMPIFGMTRQTTKVDV
jgi:hypothetical protein